MRVSIVLLIALCVLCASFTDATLVSQRRRHAARARSAAAATLAPTTTTTTTTTEEVTGDSPPVSPASDPEAAPPAETVSISLGEMKGTITFPLKRTEKYTVAQRMTHLRKLASHHKQLMKKRAMSLKSGHHAHKAKVNLATGTTTTTTSATLSLLNIYDTEWLGTISVGTPAQDFSVIFDTGSTDLWLPSTGCSTTECASQNRFDPTSSSTFVDLDTSVAAAFGSGDLYGTLGRDTVYIGNITVTSQTFCLIDEEIGSWTSANDPFDGLLGLAFPGLSDTSNTPLFDSIIDQGSLDRNEVSFFFGSYTQEDEASITFGTPPSSLYTGSLTYIEVGTQLYWQVTLKDIYVNGIALNLCENTNCVAILDTGTTLLTGPTSSVSTLVAAISANTDCSNYDSLPSITYVLADPSGETTYEFDLEPYYYIMDETWMGSDYCAPAFMSFDVSPTTSYWIIGDIFMRKYFTSYYRGSSTTDTAYVGIALGAL